MREMTASKRFEHVLQVLGSEGGIDREVTLGEAVLEIGRRVDGLCCANDSQMADRHARIEVEGKRVELFDSGKGSGVWLRVQGPDGRALDEGDQIWIGSQILLVSRDGEAWQLRHHGPDGRFREAHRIPAQGLFVGRGSDLVLDAGDTRLSRRHAQLVLEDGTLRLFDRGAHNGTYLKLRRPEPLTDGSEFRVATQRFRLILRELAPIEVELEAPSMPASGSEVESASEPTLRDEASGPKAGLAARLRRLGGRSEVAVPRPIVEAPASVPVPDAPLDAASDGPTSPIEDEVAPYEEETVFAVRVASSAPSEADDALATEDRPVLGAESETALLVLEGGTESISLEIAVGKTILEAVCEAGLPRGDFLDWECGDGGCGVCVVGVLEGADRLDPPDPALGEMKTIQITEQVVPDPRRYRLACLARVRGTVRVRKLS